MSKGFVSRKTNKLLIGRNSESWIFLWVFSLSLPWLKQYKVQDSQHFTKLAFTTFRLLLANISLNHLGFPDFYENRQKKKKKKSFTSLASSVLAYITTSLCYSYFAELSIISPSLGCAEMPTSCGILDDHPSRYYAVCLTSVNGRELVYSPLTNYWLCGIPYRENSRLCIQPYLCHLLYFVEYY